VRVVALLSAVAVFSATPNGRAQSPAPAAASGAASPKPWGPRLEFSGAPGCFGESSFRDAVAIFFGGSDPFDPSAPDVVHVTFTKIPGGYRGAVQYTPPSGDPWPPQVKTGVSCAALFDDLSLTASLRVPDHPPKVAPDPPPPDPPPKPPDRVASKAPEVFVPPPNPIPDFTPRTTLARTKAKRMDLTIALSASALMTAGFTADVGPAFQIGAEARYQDWFSLGLEVRGVLPSRIYARRVLDKSLPSSERYVDASQVTGLLVPCFRFKVYFAACAVGQVGTIISQSPVATVLAGSFALGPRFAFELPLGERFAAFAFGEALFATPATGFDFDLGGPNGEPAPNVAWDQSVVSGFFGAGFSVKFQ
jgi:hypothetical protein